MRVKIIICLLYLCSAHALAQKVKRPDSYNYTRGVEAIQNNNVEEALKYLNKEVKEYPGNGYASLGLHLYKTILKNMVRR